MVTNHTSYLICNWTPHSLLQYFDACRAALTHPGPRHCRGGLPFSFSFLEDLVVLFVLNLSSGCSLFVKFLRFSFSFSLFGANAGFDTVLGWFLLLLFGKLQKKINFGLCLWYFTYFAVLYFGLTILPLMFFSMSVIGKTDYIFYNVL